MAGNKGKMPIDDQHARRAKFVLRTAEGATPAELAEEFAVTPKTVYKWKKRPTVRADIEAYTRELIQTAARRFGNQVVFAIDGLVHLAKNAKSESVQLGAYCKIIDHLEKTLDRMAKVTADGGGTPDGPIDMTYAELMAEGRAIIDRHGGLLPEPGTYTHEPIDVPSSPVEPKPTTTNGKGKSPSDGHGGNGKH